jgi:hypothetical protein
MNWFRVPPKPDIPQDLRRFLEQRGVEAVRTLLYDGWSNPDGLTDVQKRIRVDSEERKHAVSWVEWRTAVDTRWIKIGVVAAVVAAIAAIIAAIFGFLSLHQPSPTPPVDANPRPRSRENSWPTASPLFS